MSEELVVSGEEVSGEEEGGSEFGSGLVVCLAKFSQHLSGYAADWVINCKQWMDMTPDKRLEMATNARDYPKGDAARFMSSLAISQVHMEVTKRGYDSALSNAMELWSNGASDHFYDLDPSAPEPLKELAALTLRMGHGFTGTVWTWDDWEKIHELWEKSCIALDERLGVKSDWWRW